MRLSIIACLIFLFFVLLCYLFLLYNIEAPFYKPARVLYVVFVEPESAQESRSEYKVDPTTKPCNLRRRQLDEN